ncbi:hypothetical protein CW735_17095 [Alteromonas sp. MB-3u-76]|jgi:uncharacterized protein YfaP (DUF2135 family)|uniref:PKD domain-containing protein n=1 Tax=unclassified Alteromonas TaxID=2614992 RepID=UPI000C317D5C|nr:putative Ig domain-containing protein [Alteromonas sp. MB-3u-76]AUC89682.1 hypothetical protein CW735_17095 [Alteromonas sp. MB-3u-76]
MSNKSGTIGVSIVLRNLLVSASLLVGLTACGGSDGDEDTAPSSQNQPPSANAGSDQSVDENTEVTLTGSGTDADGSIASYSWSQTNGTSVTLENADSSTAAFQAPEVITDEQLVFELTVTDDDGETATDSVQITILNIEEANQSPSANAAAPQEALESTVVSLDGSASNDSDGSISAYNWEQINNGAPVAIIDDTEAASTSVELPELAGNVEFAFRLTVTDDNGGAGQDDVVIIGRPTPGISVSDVSGNTAALNAAAEFAVRLTSQPSANVSISVSSSDEAEGVPDQSELTFTPENWQQDQIVVARGTNESVQNGEQDYQIILGSAISSDEFYSGVDADDVDLKGIELSISQPEALAPFIAASEATLQTKVTYTGNSQLSYSLLESPEGMNIDLSTGVITWIPQTSDEGQSYTVEVSANDGNAFSTTSFQVSVAASQAVVTEVEGDTLTVVDSSTTLDGMTITHIGSGQSEVASTASPGVNNTADLSQVNIEKLNLADAPSIPASIAPASDAFVIKTLFTEKAILEFPISEIPAGYSIRDINLYRLSTSEDIEGQFWSPVFLKFSFGGTQSDRTIKIELDGLKGAYFFGFDNAVSVSQNQSNNVTVLNNAPDSASFVSSNNASITCTPDEVLPEDNPGDEYRLQTCVDSNTPGLAVTVKDFGTSANATKWGGAAIEDLISWLVESQTQFDSLGLSYDNEFNVAFFNTAPNSRGLITLGYVTSGDNRKTLFLNDYNGIRTASAQSTAAHEYFHHAQSRSSIEGSALLIDQGTAKRWMIEGSARWFEDRVYDNLNTYRGTGNSRFLEQGLNSKDGDLEPYRRFAFIKLIESKCSQFDSSYINMINIDSAGDSSGIEKFANELANANCSFGEHIGSENSSSLEAALLYYSYATMFKGDITLLDSNESSNFRFARPAHQFNQTWLNTLTQWLNLTDDTEYKLNGVSNIPAVGAYSFKVPAITGELPEGKVADLVVESNREVLVSLTSEDSNFVGTNTIGTDPHTWFSTADQTSYIYDANGTVPELFVTVVNPSLDNSVNVDVYFKIRDELNVETIITSHDTGDEVSSRVVSIAGNIPAEAREATSKVTVTANGIATDTALNSDGSFVADVVVTLGENIIKAQGFNGSTPVTNEEVISIQGVENNSTMRNALISSKVVFILRWDTNSTDLDIYSTDKNDGTIWYSNRTVGLGNLDYDDTNGFGPEVVSYRSSEDDIYVNGTFDVDVHYFSGTPSTNYTLDVVFNETDSRNRRSLRFESITPHTQSTSRQNGPDGAGESRFNDILRVSCSAQRVCSLAGVDTSKLVQAGSASSQSQPVTAVNESVSTPKVKAGEITPINKAHSAYSHCMAEFKSSVSKTGTARWSCNNDGTKRWH